MTPPENFRSGSDAKELERSLTSLLRLSGRLNSLFDLDSLLDALAEQILELTDAESACAGLRTENGMCCGRFLQGGSFVSLMYDCPPGAGLAGWVLHNRTSYLTNDAAHDAVIVPEIRERFAITSAISIPLMDGAMEVIGFFEAYNKKSGKGFTQEDLKSSMAAAQIASLAIQNGLTYRKLIALAAFSRSLTFASGLEQVLEVIGSHLELNFHSAAAIFLPSDDLLMLRFQSPGFPVTSKEMDAATWCWKHGQEAGAETNESLDAAARYRPLTVGEQVIGVLGLISRPGAWFSNQQRALLAGFVPQIASAIERGLLERRLSRLRFFDESDRLQNALLAAISHEVRAPLAAITAAVTGMLNPVAPLDQEHERRLLQTAENEAKRLHRLMNNLLNVTRLQAGVSRMKLEPCDLADVVGAALDDLEAYPLTKRVFLEIPDDLPLVPMDFDLITQVLVNLFSNAFKFSPADKPITLAGQITNGKLEVSVIDRGRGVPEGDLDRAFQKFERLREFNSVDGLGLGLSICREFVEAHRGRIHLEQNPGGGTIARFTLPLAPPSFN